MPDNPDSTLHVPTYCALCISRCGAIATIENGRLTALSPDPGHPTGRALCLKGKVAPELVYHPDRLLHPMKRTNPKGDPDPGWQRISWDEALDTTATRLRELAERHGPETVAFANASPSTSALADSVVWLNRLRHRYGSPNQTTSMELCGWARWLVNIYTFGSALPAGVMPDLDNAGCVLFWGYNPSVSRIAHATATVAAIKRGARLLVVDPRRSGLAHRADEWLRVRPGSDGALALGLSHVMIERGWHDADFVRNWTNAPILVRQDTGRLLRAADIGLSDDAQALVAWSQAAGAPVIARPGDNGSDFALFGTVVVPTASGTLACRPVFQLWADVCARYGPDRVEEITGIPAAQVERTAETIWHNRPLAYMTWSGIEQQSNATQIARAIGLLYALTGDYDARGGNVEFPAVPTPDMLGNEFLSAEQRAKTLGRADRPLGPGRFDHVGSADIYRAALEHRPYRLRGLVSFGQNLLLSHADGETAAAALAALEFHVHADQFMTPSAQFADIVLPVTTPFESEALKIGFEISLDACSLVQLRRRLVAPRGEARSDTEIIFDLACRLGFERDFWGGDIDAAYRAMLAPSGIALEALRAAPEGHRVPLDIVYRKYTSANGEAPRGFNTPSRRVELYSEAMLEHGYPPLPEYEEPLVSHRRNPALAERFPMVLTCTKDPHYCESQQRGLPSLRRRAPDPVVDLHPDAAAERGIEPGDWVTIETPNGLARARARLDDTLAPNVICGQHGWWEECSQIGAPGYPALGPGSANFNLVIGHDAVDPVSGSVPMRAYVCQIAAIT